MQKAAQRSAQLIRTACNLAAELGGEEVLGYLLRVHPRRGEHSRGGVGVTDDVQVGKLRVPVGRTSGPEPLVPDLKLIFQSVRLARRCGFRQFRQRGGGSVITNTSSLVVAVVAQPGGGLERLLRLRKGPGRADLRPGARGRTVRQPRESRQAWRGYNRDVPPHDRAGFGQPGLNTKTFLESKLPRQDRLGTSEDIAGAVRRLAPGAAAYVAGQKIAVGGSCRIRWRSPDADFGTVVRHLEAGF